MTPTVLAPVKGRLLVRLPFQPRGGNYRLLRGTWGGVDRTPRDARRITITERKSA